VTAPTTQPVVVKLEGLSRTFPGFPAVHAIRPTTLAIHQGDYLAVVGPSGSGKSTLLNLIGLLDRPSSGTYVLNGLDVGNMTEQKRTLMRGQEIGFVFQSFELLNHRSSIENVMLAGLYSGVKRSQRRDAALDALDRVGLASKIDQTPSRMSGGERQRVAIARALASNPTLLLCDEPTGNLDSVTAQTILSLLDELHERNITIILITHDERVAARGTRTVHIVDGIASEIGVTHRGA
jgi:putative ABC transport system ATP-binding protein